MSESAPGLRARRRADTERTLISAARALTASTGLAGFTIERLCEDAGVSRRTFFNYFASKEDAVLGIALPAADDEATTRFLAGGIPGPLPSPTLLADLAALVEHRWASMDIAPDTVAQLIAAVEREPRLIARAIERAAQSEQADAALVELREGMPPGSLQAQAAAGIVGAIARASAGEFLSPENTESIATIYERRIAAARELFATQNAPTGAPR